VADFCEHCEGQRFDRAQVLRKLRRLRRDLRAERRDKKVDEGLAMAIKAIAGLELPHLEIEYVEGEVVH
jgi:hypothetical protein